MQVTNIQTRNDRRNRKLRPVQKLTSKAEDCPLFDLCGKRILIVGGITKIKTFYRRAIEKKALCLNIMMVGGNMAWRDWSGARIWSCARSTAIATMPV